MKKEFIFTVIIAVAFIAFSFVPAEKNNAIDNVEITTSETAGGSCDTRFETDHTFSKCDTRWTEADPKGTSQRAVLASL